MGLRCGSALGREIASRANSGPDAMRVRRSMSASAPNPSEIRYVVDVVSRAEVLALANGVLRLEGPLRS